jgi:PAS domain S-box-containing protein
MIWQNNPYVPLLILASLLALANAIFALSRRKVTGAMTLMGLCLVVMVWTVSYAMELASARLAAQLFWARVEYFGIVGVPVFFLLFALDFSGNSKMLHGWQKALLWVLPVILVILAWTNGFHHLLWPEYYQIDRGRYAVLKVEHGPAFWVLIGFSYILLAAGSWVLIRRVMHGHPDYRNQSWLVLAGAAVTWFGNFLYISPFNPFPDLDLTPLGVLVTGLIYSWGVFRLGLLSVMPIAGETVLDSLKDGVLVLDEDNRVVYINRSFEYFMRLEGKRVVGQSVDKLFTHQPALAGMLNAEATVRQDLALSFDQKTSMYFDVRISPVRSRAGQVVGRALILDEITERKRAESRLNPAIDEDPDPSPSATAIPMVMMYRFSDGKIVEVNRSFIVSLGYSRPELIGVTPLQAGVWHADERTSFLRHMREQDNRLSGYILTLHDRVGKPRKLSVSASVLDVDDDKFVVLIGHLA